jgi:MGT family glycosyltransferase
LQAPSESRSSTGRSPGALGRILFVPSPFIGHVHPTIAFGRELSQRGHTVAWTGHIDPVADLLPDWARLIPLADKIPSEVKAQENRGRRGPAGLKSTWEDIVIPINRQMVPGLQAAIETFRPDVLVVDQQALAGAAVAEARGLPWVTSATTPVELIERPDGGKIQAWLDGLLRDFMVEVGVEPRRAAQVDPRKSPYLLVAYTTAELMGEGDRYPKHYSLVGPCIGDRGEHVPFPWEWLDTAPRPRILVSLGTINWRWGERFFNVATEALAGMDVRAVLAAPPEVAPDPLPNVLVRRRVPQVGLLPHLDAVVSHGGNNTVCETLANGLPLVCSPMHDDQPMIADQVVRAGAGIRVKFFRLTAEMLREAIEAVLTDPSYRAGAAKVKASFEAAGGAVTAADRLESLLARTRGVGAA